MDEAEQLCDRLVVMDKGRIVAEGSPAIAHRRALDPRGARAAVRRRRSTTADIADRLDGIGERVEVLPDRILVYADDGEAALAAVTGRGLRPVTALVRRSTLEDVFLRLTGRTLID